MRLVTGILAALAFSATLAVEADTVFIRDATVYTMGSDGTLSNTDILVSGNTVQAIGQNLSAPEGARVIEANGRPVTPGLFAGITSIGIGEVSGVTESMDASNSMTDMRPEFDVSTAFNGNSSLIPVARVEGYGFTMLGAGGAGTIINGRGRIAALDGGHDSLYGNRVLFVALGRSAASKTGGSRAGQWMLLEQAMDEADTAPRGTEAAVLTRTGRRVLEGFTDGGTVVFGVNRASDILQVLQFAEKHGFEAVISGGAEGWMVADALAAAGAPVILNPLQNLPSNFDMLGSRLDNAALLQAAGVQVIIGGAGSHNARKQRQLAGNAVSYGLDHEAAIAALTIVPARVFGVESRFGSLEKGKRADLVMWSGDPLEVNSVADLVIIDGKVDSMQSRQTMLRDRYLPENPDLPRAYVKPDGT
jgi:imidazolonepropionase-like amidohydrolase